MFARERIVLNKNKVRLRGEHLKTHLLQACAHDLTDITHALRSRFKPMPIFDRRCGRGLRNSVQRIGIKRIFNPVQTLDELRLRNRIAHAQARQPMTLGETAGHNEVVIARNQGHGSFCAKTKVGLINDHQPIAV